jgi:hypothetical protein
MMKDVQPGTRRLVVLVLGIIALACIIAEVNLAIRGQETSDALMALASACVGGIAGLVTLND